MKASLPFNLKKTRTHSTASSYTSASRLSDLHACNRYGCSQLSNDGLRHVRLFEVLQLFLRQLHVEGAYNDTHLVRQPPRTRDKHGNLPRRSFSLSRLVVPTIGAETPGFAMHHASAICAMLTPFFLAISSTLRGH